jgi:uncharacterized protein YcbX
MFVPRLSRITVYPIKSLPGVDLDHATLTEGGALRHDREFALFDASGNYINGKRTPAIHRLGASCAIHGDTVRVTLCSGADMETFALDDSAHLAALETRLTQYFGEPVHIERDTHGGFPDDPDASGPTVVSTASLVEAAKWYAGFTAADMRRRFRANLELDDCPAFWEDRLFGALGVTVKFRVGDVLLLGTNPCKRCVVPTRDPSTGDELTGFQRTFAQQRKATLPAWANHAQFDFCYRLATNTRAANDAASQIIRLGDAVEIL